MPTALLKFSEYSPPFARYESADGRGVRVLLISQRGNRETLHGLYDIMQTLEIVPVDGERSKQRDSFVLTGQNATVHSYSWARLEDGMIKGFSLIYPPNEAKVMERVAQIMRDSFASTGPKALEIEGGAGAVAPEVDLVSGLEVRRPTVSRSGFYVDGSGTVLTVAEAVRQCGRITIDEAWEAEVDRLDEASGLAVLKPRQSLAPLAHAIFRQRQPQMSAEVAVSGFSFEGALGAPTLTYGTLSDLRGLQGNEEVQRLSVAARSGDAGGPVFDESGAVMGVLLSRGQDGRQLPDDVHFAVKPSAVEQILTQSGVQVARDEVNGVMAPEDLALLASDMTVLVSCWN
jgi:S1-C subfamily serine protease